MKFPAIVVLSAFLTFAVHPQTAASKGSSKAAAGSAKKPVASSSKALSVAKAAPVRSHADEKSEWEKIASTEGPEKRAAAIRKFLKAFPKSERRTEALELLAASEADAGNLLLQAGDLDGAAELFIRSVTDAPTPVSEKLFTEALAKIPANLYFRGAREQALRAARLLEEKVKDDPDQLLALGNFFLSIENGSEARRIAESALKVKPDSAAAMQTLGLAHRMDFQLEESATAYAKALELDPLSFTARRGLAEMKRALGKADEAILLYREILAKDETNTPARTGLILSLFDSGDRQNAEAELSRALDANSGNVILLSGVAYWYAVQGEGDKAVDLAQKAIAADPRFVWSHIALARGYMLQQRPLDAEKTLLAARRYGNFPTLEYEIASSRASAGFFRDAAEELAKSFSVSDGVIKTKLGGRIPRDSKDFVELVGFERRASIFAPTAADDPENAARLAALLELTQAIQAATPADEKVTGAGDQFIRGNDGMKLFRQLYVADALLEKKVALPKVAELAQAATANVDSALASPNSGAAAIAGEIYENRKIAITRGEYLNIPDIPSTTLSAIVRGRIEELAGWAKYQMNEPEEAVIRLKRAVSVLPADTVWWRSSTWRLGSSLTLAGKDQEALDTFVRVYKAGEPDQFRYATIAALYGKIHGNTDRLEELIGPDPSAPSAVSPSTVAKVEATPTAVTITAPEPRRSDARVPAVVPMASAPAITASPAPAPSRSPDPRPTEDPEPTPSPTPEPLPTPEPSSTPEPLPTPEPSPTPEPTPTPEATPEPITEPSPTPEMTPEPSPTPEPTPTPEPAPSEVEPTQQPTPQPTPKETSEPETIPQASMHTLAKKVTPPSRRVTPSPVVRTNELFPPVIITIPAPTKPKSARSPGSETGTDRPIEKVTPCKLTVSEENITLPGDGGDIAVIIGVEEPADIDAIKSASSSPADVSVHREPITGVKDRALFVIRSVSSKSGVYQVTFEMPCGKKDVVVRVR